MTIPLPPFAEQKRIAAVLDQVDTLRAKRREAITLLDDLAQSIFLDMFGDPVKIPRMASCPAGELGILTGPSNGIYKPASDYGRGVPVLRIDSFHNGNRRTRRTGGRSMPAQQSISGTSFHQEISL